MKAGFIGLGNIGLNIAQWMARENEMVVYDVMPAGPDDMRGRGATVAASPADVARGADIIGICVRNDKDVTDVMEGPDGILSSGRRDIIVAVHSTIRIETLKDQAAAAAKRGITLLDAPVSRDFTAGPDDKPFVFMVGGEAAEVEALRPFLDPAAKRIVHAGPLGAGMALKVCNNMLTYNGLLAVDNASRLAAATGLPLSALVEVVSNNGNASPMVIGMLSQRAGTRPATTRDRGAMNLEALVGLAEKDLDCALAIARDLGIELPIAQTARDRMRSAMMPQG